LKIIVADNSGFCFGVTKAVSTAYDSITRDGNIYTLGPIIHNDQVVNELEKRGVKKLSSIESLNENDTIIIRSHGVSKDTIKNLQEKNVKIIDATCPYVENIHKKVEDYSIRGYQVIIIGDPEHPEVIGINGWCNYSAVIIQEPDEVKNLKSYHRICVVAQTTITIERWKKALYGLLDIAKEAVIFNTICSATQQRQKSAEEMAKECDVVIVLGGYNSSNTKKLVEICNSYCPNTYHVENINEFDIQKIKNAGTVGITAGASTPDWIIKEAIEKMDNIKDTKEIGEESLMNDEKDLMMSEYEKTFVRLSAGDIVKGKIIYVNDEEASVDVGYKAEHAQ
jgi:4-hydroxy-3-methylbut-2-enyl diphosphate reductase